MVMRSPDPAAGSAEQRLVFVPSRLRELGLAVGGGVLLPLWVAGPLMLGFALMSVFTGSGIGWALCWGTLVLAALAVLVMTALLLATVVSTTVRWIEFCGTGGAAHLAVARFFRVRTVPPGGLERVVVVERLRLGDRRSVAVVLHLDGEKLTCAPGFGAAVDRVGTGTLVDWLTERAGALGAAVELRTEVERSFVCPEEWWTPEQLAAHWRVPVAEVAGLAGRYDVRAHRYEPRAGALHSPGRTVVVYDPGRAYEVAERLRAGRLRTERRRAERATAGDPAAAGGPRAAGDAPAAGDPPAAGAE
ncbi:hypothetical protein ACIQBJ_31770 [Kitasatospora sp. NPDC088391]|uniref:hypothetical protein n=1 Tax=Kitasatospora sp. NPDC088391 TaxID=3364074 RepID=UPI003800DBFC